MSEVTGSCTIVFKGVSLTPANVDAVANGLAPLIAQELRNVLTQTPTKGCSVSGSVSGGPGGVGGSVSVGCTF